MTTKTLTIMEDVYEKLVTLKKPNESFSEEIRRLVAQKIKIFDFFGAWKDVDEAEAKRMKKMIKEMRKEGYKSLMRKLR
ncbi:MAG TPA: antitoxin VapB family protein [Candidatus Nanoarchaeia archaeon]|nr:antitoxin VapB family protein [Candidatus Nanoarchaeia archaeon]